MEAMLNWNNKDNEVFYEQRSEILETWAQAGGLSTWPDLIAIETYIKPVENILEIGSGYGRVLQYLKQHHSDKKITAVEKSHELFNTLTLQFEQSVTLHQCDIANFKTQQRYDLILWLWSGLTDFSKSEQPHIIKHLQQFLTPQGTLIIETFPHDLTPSNGSIIDNQSYELTHNELSLHGYIPSPDEINTYATNAALQLKELIEYKTSSNRKRKLYILKPII
jgi:cyclopropane fatty-acyl-phospholipid synthase-like methyltransferase